MDGMEHRLSRFGHVTSRTLDCGAEGMFTEYTIDTGKSYLSSDTVATVQSELAGYEWIVKAAPAVSGAVPRLLIIAEIPVEATP